MRGAIKDPTSLLSANLDALHSCFSLGTRLECHAVAHDGGSFRRGLLIDDGALLCRLITDDVILLGENGPSDAQDDGGSQTILQHCLLLCSPRSVTPGDWIVPVSALSGANCVGDPGQGTS
jgi:hypothetical protein